MASGGGGRGWMTEDLSDFRQRTRQKILREFVQFYRGKLAPSAHEFQSVVTKFEDGIFKEARSKEEYLRKISSKLIATKRRVEEQQRSTQIRSQSMPTNAVQALQGGSSLVAPMQQAARMAPETSSLVPNRHLVHPSTPNMQIHVKQEKSDMIPVVDQYINSQPITSTTILAGVQSIQRPMRSVTRSQNQHPARPKNFAVVNPTGVPKLQGHPIVRSNVQQNYLISKGANDIGTQEPHHSMRANQQEINMKRYQMLGGQHASASKMRIGYPGGQKNQQSAVLNNVLRSPFKTCKPEPLTPPQQQITGDHRSSPLSQSTQISATLGSSEEVDLIEKIFKQINSWKNKYFSDFLELDRRFVIPELTKEQLQSLPTKKVAEIKQRVDLPKWENFVHYLANMVEKMKERHRSQNCCEPTQIINCSGNAASFTGVKSRRQEQPADASIFQSRQTTVTRTPPACQQNHSNHFLGLASPVPTSSRGAMQSLPTNKLEFLPPLPVAKSGLLQASSPCSLLKSKLSKDSDDLFAFFLDGNSTSASKENVSSHVTPTKPTMLASPLQVEKVADQAEDQVRGGGEPPAAKKAIDRLIEAMRSSSPAVLHSSVNSIWSVISMSDIAPHGNIGTSLGSFYVPQQGVSNAANKMKRLFDSTGPCSDSSMDGSCTTLECDASDSGSSREPSIKRQKSQHAKDALREEIKAINNTLMDTVISMPVDCATDGITSCNGGSMIKLSYIAVSLSPGLKSLLGTSEMSLVMPAKLFVPLDYPTSSPVLIDDKGDDLLSKRPAGAFTDSVDAAFRRALRGLPEPRSIAQTAMAWDACVRNAVAEFAHLHGGGTFSSMVCRWETCTSS